MQSLRDKATLVAASSHGERGDKDFSYRCLREGHQINDTLQPRWTRPCRAPNREWTSTLDYGHQRRLENQTLLPPEVAGSPETVTRPVHLQTDTELRTCARFYLLLMGFPVRPSCW